VQSSENLEQREIALRDGLEKPAFLKKYGKIGVPDIRKMCVKNEENIYRPSGACRLGYGGMS